MWTKQEDEDLQQLWNQKVELNLISIKMKRSAQECLQRIGEINKIWCLERSAGGSVAAAGGSVAAGGGSVAAAGDGRKCYIRMPPYAERERISAADARGKYALNEVRFVELRIVCPKERLGLVYGKSKQTLESIRNDSGAKILISPTKYNEPQEGDQTDVIITVSAFEVCEKDSPVEKALNLLRVASSDVYNTYHVFRFLIDDMQKKGIKEDFLTNLKTVTNTGIHLVPKQPYHIIQVDGEAENLEKAFLSILSKLRLEAFII